MDIWNEPISYGCSSAVQFLSQAGLSRADKLLAIFGQNPFTKFSNNIHVGIDLYIPKWQLSIMHYSKKCNRCKMHLHSSHFAKSVGNTGGTGLASVCRECYHKHYSPKSLKEPGRILRGYERHCAISYQRELSVRGMLARANHRAFKKGLSFDLNESDIVIPKRCPVLGIPLVLDRGNGRQNGSASLDRIDNKKGYTKDNTIVISLRANYLKGNATINELRKIARYYSRFEE